MFKTQKREAMEPCKPLSTQLIDNLLGEINEMFEYATQSGKRVKPGLRSSLARLYSLVESCDPADLLVQKGSTVNKESVTNAPSVPGTGQVKSKDLIDRETDSGSQFDAEETLDQSTNIGSAPAGALSSDESKNHPGDSKATISPGAEGAGHDGDIAEDDEEEESPVELILRVHSELAVLVSPATPASIEATRSLGGGFRINNPVVNGLVYLTLLSLVGFLILSGIKGMPDQDSGKTAIVPEQNPVAESSHNDTAAGPGDEQATQKEDVTDE